MSNFVIYFVCLRTINEQTTKTNKMPDNSIEQLDVIKQYLPYNYLSLIKEKIESDLSDRLIQYIINGERPDHHKVIDAAIDIALDEKMKRDAIAKRLKKLHK